MKLSQHRITPIQFSEAARLVYGSGHFVQLFAEIQARRDGKTIQPGEESLPEPVRQLRLITEVHDIQGPLRRKQPGGALQHGLPAGNHRQSVRNDNAVEAIDAKERFWIKR